MECTENRNLDTEKLLTISDNLVILILKVVVNEFFYNVILKKDSIRIPVYCRESNIYFKVIIVLN